MPIAAAIAAVVVLVVVLRALAMRGETVRAAPRHLVSAPLTEDSIRELLLGGRKIEAIKAYRTLHKVDLKDAKGAIDRLAEQIRPRR